MVLSQRNAGPAKPPIDILLSPFQRFVHTEASGGIVLLACAALALVAANSSLASAWHGFWSTPISIGVGEVQVSHGLDEWINEALMAVFFFVVGLEIRREVLAGELSTRGKSALPITAAAGGMIVPALIYTAFNWNGPGRQGWGIPMATDIAFALGVMALAGPLVPLGLKVFMSALAIADDIGAVIVIALFYTSGIYWTPLLAAGVIAATGLLAGRLGVRTPGFFGLVGVALWFAFLAAGLHATLAGVVAAMLIPSHTRVHPLDFSRRARAMLDKMDATGVDTTSLQSAVAQREVLENLEVSVEAAQSPMLRLERTLHPWVAFVVMPLFALANAGIAMPSGVGSLSPVAVGTALALVVGKPLGIVGFSVVALRTGIAALPDGVSMRHLLGAGFLGGIGFTMSLFVASLAFEGSLLADAKVGILVGSAVAGLAGLLILRGAAPTEVEREAGAGEPYAGVKTGTDQSAAVQGSEG
jgi:NhaA family Na+:H+ antiporter